MNLKDFANPITSPNAFIKASFGGFAGSGKTRTATDFIIGAYKHLSLSKPILIIDNEKGSRFLVPIFKKAGIATYLKDTVHLADIIDAFALIEKGEVDFLFIDSLSKVWYQFIRDYRKKHGNKSMTLQDWGKVIPEWQEQFSDRFVNLNGSCVFTGRGGYTYDMEEDENGKKAFAKSGVKMKLAGETPFEPDLNAWMSLEQDMNPDGTLTVSRSAQILKDRSGIIDGKTFKNPTYKDFKPIVDFITALPMGDVSRETNTTNLAPSDDNGWRARQEQREAELEKIKAIFDKSGLGTSKEDKQLKVIIVEKIFGTASWIEIEKMQTADLMVYRTNLAVVLENVILLTDHSARVTYVQGVSFTNDMVV